MQMGKMKLWVEKDHIHGGHGEKQLKTLLYGSGMNGGLKIFGVKNYD